MGDLGESEKDGERPDCSCLRVNVGVAEQFHSLMEHDDSNPSCVTCQ